MKCMSCLVEINPQWRHAIDINVCPFCGKGIMEEHLKNLFFTLRETMESLKQYPDQLDDWMLSNHNYIKTDSKQLSQYLPKQARKSVEPEEKDNEEFIVNVKTENGEEPVVAKKIQTNERTNSFFKRAEALRPGIDGFDNLDDKTKHIKGLVKRIQEEGSSSIGFDGETSILSAEMMDSADPEAVAEFQSLISGGDPIASSLSEMGSGDDDDVPSVVMAMASKAKGGNNNAKDLASLQNMVNKSKGKSGGGSFSRSGS